MVGVGNWAISSATSRLEIAPIRFCWRRRHLMTASFVLRAIKLAIYAHLDSGVSALNGVDVLEASFRNLGFGAFRPLFPQYSILTGGWSACVHQSCDIQRVRSWCSIYAVSHARPSPMSTWRAPVVIEVRNFNVREHH